MMQLVSLASMPSPATSSAPAQCHGPGATDAPPRAPAKSPAQPLPRAPWGLTCLEPAAVGEAVQELLEEGPEKRECGHVSCPEDMLVSLPDKTVPRDAAELTRLQLRSTKQGLGDRPQWAVGREG